MPTKEAKTKVEEKETVKKKTTTATKSTTKKATSKVSVSKADKTTKSKPKTTTTKKNSKTTTKATPKKTTKSKSSTTTKAKNSKSAKLATSKTTKTKITKKATTKETKSSKEKTIQILEYYDLPYRYNETIVKILAQTPKILFVYWDMSDDDRQNLINQYGEYFFNDTYPVLIVYNKTKNYTIEVPINDFANSWYLNLQDANCEYNIELGRRFKEYAKNNPAINIPENNYIRVTNSNDLIMPNDKVLLDELKPEVQYRNVQTGEITYKNITKILVNQKLKDFYELYKNIYQVEKIDTHFFDFKNPGSSNPTSTFR